MLTDINLWDCLKLYLQDVWEFVHVYELNTSVHLTAGSLFSAYLWVRQSFQVGVEVEVDPPGGSWKGDPSDQQDQ